VAEKPTMVRFKVALFRTAFTQWARWCHIADLFVMKQGSVRLIARFTTLPVALVAVVGAVVVPFKLCVACVTSSKL